MVPTSHVLFLGAALFCLGLAIILTKKNTIVVLMGVELMLNAANLNFIAFARMHESLEGQIMSLFVIVLAAAEAAVGLALVLRVYQYFKTADIDRINSVRE
ncbi:MAG TPA: NADH-quinone oxidoreductase subunit NuoK [Cytophagales bacterium]|nr:NADH-quinone oxidoreductase subunit NuoK [Cytophagales bacterium]HAA19738.1 NADH-quinone oxidoreductase subunit NuoK [Cytophagales bacterium]HAP61599.1 NADH-quinone oxidoreductase subunit NuoK [Cytophagales bacterium]